VDPAVLADAGGWAVVIAMIGMIGLGAIKGWWVPGFVWRREVERGDKATALLEGNTPLLREILRLLKRRPLP
jgi:hypothetical protein